MIATIYKVLWILYFNELISCSNIKFEQNHDQLHHHHLRSFHFNPRESIKLFHEKMQTRHNYSNVSILGSKIHRLAVVILYTYGSLYLPGIEMLNCSISKIQNNLAANTPTDIFVFVPMQGMQ